MAQDNKIFSKEKPNLNIEKKSGKSDIKIEKLDLNQENKIEKGAVNLETTGEEKKPLEKIGEAFRSNKKADISLSSSDLIRQKQIDAILSEGLNDIFLSMDTKQQKIFKEEGEKTTVKINLLLNSAKVKLKNIIDLIKNWLKLIPKVNPYFLEQEAKIKADKIIKLKK
jgi:hypothetical protein